MTHASNETIARAFFTAMERRDYDAFTELCTPDAEIWHNTDGTTLSLQDAIAALRALEASVRICVYAIERAIESGNAVAVKFTLQVTRTDGSACATTACGIFDIRDGRVARLEEYYDGQSLQRLFFG